MRKRSRVVVVVTSATNGPGVRAVARWVRALLPAATLVVSAPDFDRSQRDEDQDAIIVDADGLPSGPLALAAVLTRAANGNGNTSAR